MIFLIKNYLNLRGCVKAMGTRSTSQIWSISAAWWDETDMYHVSAHFSFLWKRRCAGKQGVELHFHSPLGLDQLENQDEAHTAPPPVYGQQWD